MSVTWRSLLAASFRAQATTGEPAADDDDASGRVVGHPRSEKRGAAASRPASAGGADSSRSVSRSASWRLAPSAISWIARVRSSSNRISSCHGRTSTRDGLSASSTTARIDFFDPFARVGRVQAARDLGCFSCGDPHGRHGRPRDHSRHRTTPFPRSSASPLPSHLVADGIRATVGAGRSCRTGRVGCAGLA